jgi:hypothetical protein
VPEAESGEKDEQDEKCLENPPSSPTTAITARPVSPVPTAAAVAFLIEFAPRFQAGLFLRHDAVFFLLGQFHNFPPYVEFDLEDRMPVPFTES